MHNRLFLGAFTLKVPCMQIRALNQHISQANQQRQSHRSWHIQRCRCSHRKSNALLSSIQAHYCRSKAKLWLSAAASSQIQRLNYSTINRGTTARKMPPISSGARSIATLSRSCRARGRVLFATRQKWCVAALTRHPVRYTGRVMHYTSRFCRLGRR